MPTENKIRVYNWYSVYIPDFSDDFSRFVDLPRTSGQSTSRPLDHSSPRYGKAGQAEVAHRHRESSLPLRLLTVLFFNLREIVVVRLFALGSDAVSSGVVAWGPYLRLQAGKRIPEDRKNGVVRQLFLHVKLPPGRNAGFEWFEIRREIREDDALPLMVVFHHVALVPPDDCVIPACNPVLEVRRRVDFKSSGARHPLDPRNANRSI
ncbi:hypothetical protein C8R44DRAFT_772475 [Mycena epipterygia]|nr:hypothetical protein C8R44DRAFT_772475 [Mycena epipterygia]